MRVYRVCPPIGEATCPGDPSMDTYYSSEVAARKEFREWLEVLRGRGWSDYVGDLTLDRMEIADTLSRKKLILAILNGRGYVTESVTLKYADRGDQ